MLNSFDIYSAGLRFFHAELFRSFRARGEGRADDFRTLHDCLPSYLVHCCGWVKGAKLDHTKRI